MRILALADIHGAFRLALQILTSGPAYDLVLIAGDLTTHGTPDEAARAIDGFRVVAPHLLAVAGNMDTGEIDAGFLRAGISIHGRGVCVDGVGIFGVSGGPISPLLTPYELPEEEILRHAERGLQQVAGAATTVFVPHAPPYGTQLDVIRNGQHVGSTAVRAFIEKHQPDVTVCGHIHEAAGLDAIGKTKIINCGPAHRGSYGLISLGGRIEVQRLRFMPPG
jgi:Icc-related predicted phosphoesterase